MHSPVFGDLTIYLWQNAGKCLNGVFTLLRVLINGVSKQNVKVNWGICFLMLNVSSIC